MEHRITAPAPRTVTAVDVAVGERVDAGQILVHLEHHEMAEPIRIANCSGFYGDRLSAAREMVDGGPIDVLTGDWLAELTMLILARRRAKRPRGGFARRSSPRWSR